MKTFTASVALSAATAVAALALPAFAQETPSAPATAPAAQSGAQSADEMMAAIRAVPRPKLDPARREDPEYVREYREAMTAAMAKQADLALAFVRAHPTNNEAGGAAAMALQVNARLGKPVEPLIAELIALPLNDDAKGLIRAIEVQAMLSGPTPDLDGATAKLDALKRDRPKDERLAQLALMIASETPGEARTQRLRAIVADYPGTSEAESATGMLRRVDGVGKPFELTFTEAVTGKTIDVQKDLKGKVVVVDFWATWCGPCIADMPRMKELYDKFHGQGVEFVGISLDVPEAQGGKQKLLDYVASNGVKWPQYYQGNYWDSDFSKSWGINSIPALFVVDAEGKLADTEARAELEELIPKLIAQRDAK